MDPKHDLVRQWLEKARRDLGSAERLAADPDPYYDTAIYHCQQAVEKAIKGWLTFHDQRFEKTHDIRLLISLATKIEPGFSDWFEEAERLNPYATAYRYPGEEIAPDRDEFNQAFLDASNVLDFIYSLLPSDVL